MVRDILCIVFCILLAFILLLLVEIEIGFQDDTSKVRKKVIVVSFTVVFILYVGVYIIILNL